MSDISSVGLRVMTIRNGRTGEQYDKAAVLSGKQALMAHTKIKVDSFDNPKDATQASAANVRFRLFYNDVLDLETDGLGRELAGEGAHFAVANLGSWAKSGYQAQFKLAEGDSGGDNTARVETEHSGVVSNSIIFPAVD